MLVGGCEKEKKNEKEKKKKNQTLCVRECVHSVHEKKEPRRKKCRMNVPLVIAHIQKKKKKKNEIIPTKKITKNKKKWDPVSRAIF